MTDQTPYAPMIGNSPAFLAALEQASMLASLDKPVLVVGERGTGKELIAQRLHYLSPRWQQSFIQLNCASLNDNLLETELFGHEAGAFTGAQRKHLGRFERAHLGTLFLDEIANTSSRVQEKLLRVIEYGQFERVGGHQPIQIHVRLIAATNADLPTLAEEERFRADLLDRLAFDVITLPPLRERTTDIVLLAEHFAIQMTQALKRDFFAGFSRDVVDALETYAWPGNVRELKNVIERATYATAPDQPVAHITLDPFASPYRPMRHVTTTTPSIPTPAPLAPAISLPLSMPEHITAYEQQLLQAALQKTRYNQKQAAAQLGISYHQLRAYLRKYRLLQRDETSA